MPRGDKYEKIGDQFDGLTSRTTEGETSKILSNGDAKQRYWCGHVASRQTAILLGIAVAVVVLGALGTAAFFVTDLILRDRDNKKKSDDAVRPCDSPFGSFNGCVGGVPARSNCNSYHASFEDNYMNVTDAATNRSALNVFTGMKFQCVEYSRRFLASSPVLGKYVTFGGLDGASDIFPLTNVSSIFDDSVLYAFETYENGKPNNTAPQFGDLVIYPKQGTWDDFPFGHVSVVSFVDLVNMTVGIGEQNWANAPWPAQSPCEDGDAMQYARLVPLVYDKATNSYSMVDPAGDTVQGWKRVGGRI